MLVESHRLPRRTTTGLEGLQYAAVHRKGSLFLQGNGPRPEACSPCEARAALVFHLQPLIAEWSDLDRAVLVLRMRDWTVREIKRELGVSGDRVCDVIRKVRAFCD